MARVNNSLRVANHHRHRCWAVPGVAGLSFVDDIGWWAEGVNEEAVATKLSEAAAASIEWAA